MSEWLSPEWFEKTRPIWSELRADPGTSARLQYEISGGPERAMVCHWIVEGGRLVDSGPGPVDDADVTVSIVWDDALAMARDDLDPNVAFMQGRMKVAGSMAPMLALLPLVRTEAGRDLRRRVADVTLG